MKKYNYVCLRCNSYEKSKICSTLDNAKRTAKRLLTDEDCESVTIYRYDLTNDKIDDAFNEIECVMHEGKMFCLAVK